jgi:dihydrofolate reductase
VLQRSCFSSSGTSIFAHAGHGVQSARDPRSRGVCGALGAPWRWTSAERSAREEMDSMTETLYDGRRNHMRKLIFAINMSIDGCCDHTKLTGNEEIHEYHTHLLRDIDVLAFGRKTYQLMVPFWPDIARNRSGETKAMNDFAQAFDSVNKIIVFSQSLDSVEGKNTRIVRTNLRDEILKLKQEQGKNILTGGLAIPSQLIELDLIDEYHVVVQPFVVGEGRRLLDRTSLPEKLQLKLADSKTLKSGSVALRYLKQ